MFALDIGNRLAQSIFGRTTTYESNVPPIEWDQNTITEFFHDSFPNTHNPIHSLKKHIRYLMVFNEFCMQRNIKFQ